MQQQHRRGFESSKCDIEGIVAKNCVKDISLRQALEKKQRETTTRGSSTQIAKVAVSPFIVYKGRYGTLNLVDCEVTVIDDISSVDDSLFHRGPICTLYLSNNLISSLDGIEQEVFRTITKLSLSNNDIRRINDLLPLSKLPKLITLSLNGNPVTHLPYFKQEVLTICTGLGSLDGVNINSPADFLIAQSCIFKYRDRRNTFAEAEIKKYILTRWLQWSPVLAEIRHSQHNLRQRLDLAVAISGGLGSWMQIMSGEYFELQVQTLLNQKGMRRKKRSKFSTRPESDKSDEEKGLASVNVRSDIERWDDFVSEFAKQQCQQLLDLEERCCEMMGNWKSVRLQANTLSRGDITLHGHGNELKEENIHDSVVRLSYDYQVVTNIEIPPCTSHSKSLSSDPAVRQKKMIKQPSLSLRTSSDKENILETASVSSKASTSTAKLRSAEVNYDILQEKMLLLKRKQIQRQQEIQDRYTELLQTHLRTEEKRSRGAVRMPTKAKDGDGDGGSSGSSIAQSVLHWKVQATNTSNRSSDRSLPLVQANPPLHVESSSTEQAGTENTGVSLFERNTSSFSLNSSVLPVQQCEPEDLSGKDLNEAPHPFLDYVQSFTARASLRLVVTSETTKDDPQVLEPWVSLGEEIAGFLRGIASDFTAYKSSADKVNPDLLTQQQAQPSMRDLKVDVQRAIQEQSLLQRQEFIGRDINTILHASLQEFHDKCKTMYCSFLESISEGSSSREYNDLISTTKKLRKEITFVASDIAQCERDNWMGHARSIASSYENLQKEAAVVKQSLLDAEARLQLIDSALADGQDVQERLLNSNSEVKRALGDIHGYIRNSSDLQHLLIVFARIMKSPTMDLESASLMARTLMKKSFDKLVLSASRNVRLKRAEAQIFERSARKTYLSYFRRWYRAFQLDNICSRFMKKRIVSTKRLFYSLWTSRVFRSHLLGRHLNQQRLLSVTRSLKDWKVFAVRSRVESRRSAQHDLCVRLYLTLKAFRGWKSFVTSSMASLQRTFLEVWKKRSYWVVLGAWKLWKQAFECILVIHPITQADKVVYKEVTSQRRQLLVSLNDMFVASRLRICWKRWTALYNFRVLLCLYRAKKRGLQLLLKSLRESKRRNTKNMKCIYGAIEWRNKRRLRQLSLFISFLKRRRQKGIIRQKRIQAVLTARRLKSWFLKWLKRFLVRVGQNVSKYTESIPLILKTGRSGLDAVLAVPGKRAAHKDTGRGVATNSLYEEEKQSLSFPHKPMNGQLQVPVFYLNVGRFQRQSMERLRARFFNQPKTDNNAVLDSLELRVQTLSSTRLLRRYFQILSQEFLRSQLQQCRRHAVLTERCKQTEGNKKVDIKGIPSANSSSRFAMDALNNKSTPSQFCESPTLVAEKLKNLDIQIAEFLRDRAFITKEMRDLESEEEQVLAATKLREETDTLQTDLTELESQIHDVDLTRADLQASVNALEHSVDDARKQLEEYACEGLLFHELQQRLVVLSQESHLAQLPGSSLSPVAAGEGLDQLRNMEDLYQEAVTSLSVAAGNTDQVDDILSTRKARLGALRFQLREKDLICEEMRYQKGISQQKAQDVARALEDTLRNMAAQALDYDQQIAALDAEAAEAERDQRELLAAEQRLRAFQEHRHALIDTQVRKQAVSSEQGASVQYLLAAKAFSAGTQAIQSATPLVDMSPRSDSREEFPILPSVPFTTQLVRSYESVLYDSTDDELGGRIRAVAARIRDRLNSAI